MNCPKCVSHYTNKIDTLIMKDQDTHKFYSMTTYKCDSCRHWWDVKCDKDYNDVLAMEDDIDPNLKDLCWWEDMPPKEDN